MDEFSSHSAPPRLVLEGRPGDPCDDPGFLFSLPEYGHAFATVLFEGIENLAESKSPVLRELATNQRTERVRTNRYTTPTGGTVDLEPKMTSSRYGFTVYDITRFDLRALARGLILRLKSLRIRNPTIFLMPSAELPKDSTILVQLMVSVSAGP